jgi:hypothetical protein
MATSSVPAAIDALLALLRAAPELADVQVLDGPPVGDLADADYVTVGWQPGADEGASLSQSFAYAGARVREEDSVILGYVESWSGDTDMKARRDRAFELLGVVESVIRASGGNPTAPTLGGVVQWAEFTAGSLRQISSDQGLTAGIGWSVTCKALI